VKKTELSALMDLPFSKTGIKRENVMLQYTITNWDKENKKLNYKSEPEEPFSN
jgi:hypothetical protein